MKVTNPSLRAAFQTTLDSCIRRSISHFRIPKRLPVKTWAINHRFLSALEAAKPGKYRISVTPYLDWANGPLDALNDPVVEEIVCQKSAQVAWTSGVLGNALGAWIDSDPSPIVVLFPKEGAAKEYVAEKFEPMIEATPRLKNKIDLRSRKSQQRQLFKRFPGGFIKFVGSNSPSSVKSTPTPRVAVEEPDDCNANLKAQGDSIKLAKERVKTYDLPRKKIIIGGTPTIAGLSAIEAEMDLSDKRVGMIPCHECGAEHVLHFDNFRCLEDDSQWHPVFKNKVPDTSYYACPHCSCVWDDDQKNNNVKKGRWEATAPFSGVAGFYLNELYSPFPGSRFAALMKKWLTALAEAEKGEIGSLIAFTNSSMGLAYEYKGDTPEESDLRERELDYEPGTMPSGGLILTAGIDVQHDRLEIIIRAWGRGEESWLVLYDRLYGNPLLVEDNVWQELDKKLFALYPNELGVSLRITAATIDSSDGTTSEAVYKYVRSRAGRIQYLMAGKGHTNPDKIIFSKPSAPIQTNNNNTKAAKYGVQVFNVGVGKAKDLLIGEKGRVSLTGDGPGRFHVYKDVSPEYYEQLLAEVKAPRRGQNGVVIKVWQKKSGKRNEVLDCEVYALHASRAAKIELMNTSHWDAYEAKLRQPTLFDSADAVAPVQQAPTESRPPQFRRTGFATGWKR